MLNHREWSDRRRWKSLLPLSLPGERSDDRLHRAGNRRCLINDQVAAHDIHVKSFLENSTVVR